MDLGSGCNCPEDLCKFLRNSLLCTRDYLIEKYGSDDSFNIYHNHEDIIKRLRYNLAHDNPPHIVFPGSKDSYVQVSSEFPCPRAYTLCFWLKIDEDPSTRAFLLLRCRCPTGGVDVILRDRQSDGRWSIVAQAVGDSVNTASEKQEIKDNAFISAGRWHLLSVRHQTAYIRTPQISIAVDGKVELEQGLPYPYSSSPVQSQWIFGLGLKGLVSSIVFYTEDVNPTMINLIYRQGPFMLCPTAGVVGVPQSSFDSGHVILGSQISKGPYANTACKLIPTFYLTPQHFLPAANLLQTLSGKQNVDHIEMTARSPEEHTLDDQPLVPTMSGSCSISLPDDVDAPPSRAAEWIAAGGCALVLYLIGEYVATVNAEIAKAKVLAAEAVSSSISAMDGEVTMNGATSAALTTTSDKASFQTCSRGMAAAVGLVKEAILLLADLVRASPELKEQFIQIHGFHVLGRYLSKLEDKQNSICKGMVDCCFDLTLALGIDMERGDGVYAAIQGLLFDFTIWGACSDAVKLHLLNGLANIVDLTGEHLYRSLGMQRILDALKIYIFDAIDGANAGVTVSKGALVTSTTTTAGAASMSLEVSHSTTSDRVDEAAGDDAVGAAQSFPMECADAAARLIDLVVDAALTHTQRHSTKTNTKNNVPSSPTEKSPVRGPFYHEAEVLSRSLEETRSCLFAERLLRVMSNLRTLAPAQLLRTLLDNRFPETSAVALLTKRGLSAEVRRETLANTLWMYGEALKQVPVKLLQLRKSLLGTGASLSMKGDSRTRARAGSSAGGAKGSAVQSKPEPIPKEFLLMQSEIRSIVRPLERAWLTTTMLSEVLCRTLKDGSWETNISCARTFSTSDSPEIDIDLDKAAVTEEGSNSPIREKKKRDEKVDPRSSHVISHTVGHAVDQVLVVFSHDGPLGTVNAYVVLPLLPVLLSYGSHRCNQRALMSLNVLLKTDEGQCATLSALPDRSWVRLFVAMALVGERGRLASITQADQLAARSTGVPLLFAAGGGGADAPTVITSTETGISALGVPTATTLGKCGLMSEADWRADADVAATSSELALDALSTVLESKIRYSGPYSWSAWNCLQNCLKSGCKTFKSDAEAVELRFLKRCVSLVLQRLARSSDGWSSSVLTGVENILTFIENRQLCGNISSKPGIVLGLIYPTLTCGLQGKNAARLSTDGNSSPIDVRGRSATADKAEQSPSASEKYKGLQLADEFQIMCFMMDMLQSLRRATERGMLAFEDSNRPLRIGLNIILACLRVVSDAGADRISNEIFSQLIFMGETFGTSSTDEYKDFVLLVFGKLQDVVLDPAVPEALTGRYTALVYLIMHHFQDLRHTVASGVSVPPHVLPVVDDMAGVDTCNDVRMIFRLLEVTLRAADTITFDDMHASALDELMSNGTSSAGASFCLQDSRAQQQAHVGDLESDSQDASHCTAASPTATAGAVANNAEDVVVVWTDELAATVETNDSNDAVETASVVFSHHDPPEDPLIDFSESGKKEGLSSPSEASCGASVPAVANSDVGSDADDESTKKASPTSRVHSAVTAASGENPLVALQLPVLPHHPEPSFNDACTARSTTTEDAVPLLSEPSYSPRAFVEIEGSSKLSESDDGNTREGNYQNWLKIRKGILEERLDTERARLARSQLSLEFSAEAADKHLEKLRRKVESESFYDSHDCQWKLGVAHEGFFPSRRRVVLRPRYDVRPEGPSPYGPDRVCMSRYGDDLVMDDFESEGRERKGKRGDGDMRSDLKLAEDDTSNNLVDTSEIGFSESRTGSRHGSVHVRTSRDLFADSSSPLGKSSRDIFSASLDMNDAEDIRLKLAKACAGHIQDVTLAESSIETPSTIVDDVDPIPHRGGSPVGPKTSSTATSFRPPKASAPPASATAAANNNGSPANYATSTASQNRSAVAPGSGWGLVDADDSEEGYGVVGLETLSSADYTEECSADTAAISGNGDGTAGPHTAAIDGVSGIKSPHGDMSAGTIDVSKEPAGASVDGSGAPPLTVNCSASDALTTNHLLNDMMGDVRIIEDAIREGRGAIETGPCLSGTRRAGNGPLLMESRVIMVTASGNVWGTLAFNAKELFFTSSLEPEDGHKDDSAAVNLTSHLRMRRRRWTISAISAVYLRRYRLRDTAMEVFFRRGKHRNFFVDFGHTRENEKQRLHFARALMDASPPSAFKQWPSLSQFRLVAESGAQQKWLSGQMSNFDYLMALNTISGRSYNDLCQYPVMPWVLAKFEDPFIDLTDPASFRDLSKPVGALNKTRLKEFLERFYSFGDQAGAAGAAATNSSGSISQDTIPPFMYGSHYSTMVGVVLHFLVRLQPFAALHKEMQNGHFDVPDRLFSSIPRSFRHNTTQLSEVKELTPEWFSLPEMFKNVNNFDFGVTQDGEHVGDVELPPWAKTAEDFVRINRDALESDYVSEHLHEWIDLIFGYKQRGPAAVEACNVFYYLTYSGSVNRDVMVDEALRRATELQIAHFGQIPMQLFNVPHPVKRLRGRAAVNTSSIPRSLISCFKRPDVYHNQSAIRRRASRDFDLARPDSTNPSVSETQTPTQLFEDCAAQQKDDQGDLGLSEEGNKNEATAHATSVDVGDKILFVADFELSTLPVDMASYSSSAEVQTQSVNPDCGGANATDKPRTETEKDEDKEDEPCLFQIGMVSPSNDEEAIALEAKCTLVQRPFAATSSLSPPRGASILLAPGAFSDASGDPPSYMQVLTMGPSPVSPGVILTVSILSDRIICIMGSGVIESYKYATSEVAKAALSAAAALPAQFKRTYSQLLPKAKSAKKKIAPTSVSGVVSNPDRSTPPVIHKEQSSLLAAESVDLIDFSESAASGLVVLSDNKASKGGSSEVNATSSSSSSLLDQPLISFNQDGDENLSKVDKATSKVEPSRLSSRSSQGRDSPFQPITAQPLSVNNVSGSSPAPLRSQQPRPKTHSPPTASSTGNVRGRALSAATASGQADGFESIGDNGIVQLAHPSLMSPNDHLVSIERDGTHFRVLPRLPLTRVFYRREVKIIGDDTNSDIDKASSSNSRSNSSGQLSGEGSGKGGGIAGQRLMSPYQTLRHNLSASQSQFTLEQAAELVVFTRTGRLALCGGLLDGSITVREIDGRTGFVLGAADFRGHRNRVVCISTASIPTAHADVIASCDAFGQTLVWMISRMRSVPTGATSVVLSRRPQRIFRCRPSSYMRCDVSMQTGVVAVVSCGVISIFSIERDELLRSFEFSIEVNEKSTTQSSHNVAPSDAASTRQPGCEKDSPETSWQELRMEMSKSPSVVSVTGGVAGSAEKEASSQKESAITGGLIGLSCTGPKSSVNKPGVIAKRIVLCDDGSVILHVVAEPRNIVSHEELSHSSENKLPNTSSESTSDPAASTPVAYSNHFILSYSLSGARTGYCAAHSALTFMGLPDRSGEVLITGHEDGSVMFLRTTDLLLLYGPWYPHMNCVLQPPNMFGVQTTTSSGSRGATSDIGGTTYHQLMQAEGRGRTNSFKAVTIDDDLPPETEASPVVCVRVGPNPLTPAIICVTTSSGSMFVRALPDFIRWERLRSPSTLAQLVSAPLQAVRGTIQQAHNFGTYASETYGVFKENAKTFVDETLGELKKINKAKVLNFFGFGKSDKK